MYNVYREAGLVTAVVRDAGRTQVELTALPCTLQCTSTTLYSSRLRLAPLLSWGLDQALPLRSVGVWDGEPLILNFQVDVITKHLRLY